ncbi:MAG TPA: glycine zipper 2TM domain-containing protein [Gemmatimonadaceae bacterium]|nr:glycine zipper 2TM domain-containing protein [Gemmatimonadaceae bacterium]
MSQYIRHFAAPLALTAALVVGACGTKDNASDTALATDSAALNRDLARAGTDTGAQPALKDVPATPAATPTKTASTPPKRTTTSSSGSTTRTPTPTKTASGNTVTKSDPAAAGGAAATGGGAVGMIASGTTINLASSQKVCTNTHNVGDTFTATVAEAVTGSNGAVIPAGATANVRVTEVKKSENVNDPIRIGLAVSSISINGRSYPVDAEVTDVAVARERASTRGNDAKKVAIGAAAGAVLGQVIGKNTKGTVIGAAGGAAAGAAAAAATADYNGCVNQGGRIQIRLNAGTQIRA